MDNSFVLGGASPASGDTLLLVWDAPNMDMGLGAILGGRPSPNHRPRFDAIGHWLLAKAGELAHHTGVKIEAEATVFTNVSTGSSDAVRPWVEALRNIGFAVFAKPKLTDDTDVDPDMLEHIEKRHKEGVLKGVIVASADGQNFLPQLEELANDGVVITVIGFHEHASWAVASEHINFVDLEEIPGVFREPLPRISLDSLPDHGAWLPPFRPLSSLLTGRG
ncbi:NYN domain-containing protein [Corynebacterium sp. ES2794-CONJ1]|uniref:NYN domain-containing protein n=1 Tax=unclassified Corynebacterium TaxID=2624378 RepID=UPI002166D844|nr:MULTISPECIES: NYN domain-containing protein [unclassified Corynebacterium]MCS4490148.1 NYN domain-containing protein [Corynebacterium sp. ES2775-CONJ]MCS4492040.1 NYN domain-containing protein [Corynebacterium sp. ES2715-CONJ3]MCS4532145.1 NYN domain-containing protein [Corynebacterium sp. ES2730-CONJ]MCU9519547.1 NYN domain-containing protein [Corynebacterium sp. ES2794-CONJ1]